MRVTYYLYGLPQNMNVERLTIAGRAIAVDSRVLGHQPRVLRRRHRSDEKRD